MSSEAKSRIFPDPAVTREESPPPYGAQQRQDALWKGGNEALPPSWQQFATGDGSTLYQDDSLFMVTRARPLPGVRLDEPGDLHIPTWEWHISPLGRSYFVNHNTRTTSWERPRKEHPPGSFTPHSILEGHSEPVWSVACVGANVMSASGDGLIRQWTRNGRTVGQPWRGGGGAVKSLAVSPDGTLTVSGGADGRIRLWDIEQGRIIGDPWKGHNAAVRYLDWSPNGQEIASGSFDGTIRRWNPDTGRQIASPIETGQCWLYNIKYSPQGDKLASSASDGMTRVWSMDGDLVLEIKYDSWMLSLCWSKDGTCIFSGSTDGTIRKCRLFDGEELGVLRGHTNPIPSLCLFPDGRYLVSASEDCSVHIWDLESDKQIGEPLLHDGEVHALAISLDGKCMASAGLDKRVYLWNLEEVLKWSGNQNTPDGNTQSDGKLKERVPSSGDILNIPTKSKQLVNEGGPARYGNDFWGIDTNRDSNDSAPLASPSSYRRNLFDFLWPRRWNLRFFTGTSSRTGDVATARDDDRYYIAPPTEAEMAAAMQDFNGSGERSGAAAEGPIAQLVQDRNSALAGNESYVIRCCGIVIHRAGVRPHPTSH